MRVLFVNHTGLVSGAERSLLDLVSGLAARGADVAVACPDGPLARRLAAIAVQRLPAGGMRGSLRLHPVHTPWALVELAGGSRRLRRTIEAWKPDVVHANSIRAGLLAGLALIRAPIPLVVHARDVLPPAAASRVVWSLLRRRARVVVAISEHAAQAIARAAPGLRPVVAHNPVDLERFDPERVDRAAARRALGVDDATPLVGVLAQLTPWKGQDDAIRALAVVRRSLPSARLWIVGEAKFVGRATRYDNRAYAARLRSLAARLGVADAVRFLGERDDVPEIVAALDIVLVPSWDEPFGRTVVEAMAMGTPVVATAVGGPAEILEDGREGLLLAPRQPDRWAAAIVALLDDPRRRSEMSERARARAAHFERHAYAQRMSVLYEDVRSQPRRAR